MPLRSRIIELACAYGYRRITALLRWDGWRVNHQRVKRIWRCGGLKVPKKQRKRGRLWLNDGSCVRLRPARRDKVCVHEFVHDRTENGWPLRLLVPVDEYMRACLSIDVARKMSSDEVLERLSWLSKVGVKTLFIEPGSPCENG